MAIVSTVVTASAGDAYNINSGDPVLVLEQTGAIVNSGGHGIHAANEGTPFDVDVTINGLVFGTSSGFWFDINGGSVTIGETGYLKGAGYGIVVFNSASNPDAVVNNAGYVAGAQAIFLGLGDDTVNNTGVIESTGTNAVQTREGADKLVNSGQIIGDVDLGADNDTFVAKAGGTVTGTINGGAGDDTYRIIDNSLTLDDTSGIDTIKSWATHTLAAAFENLTLLGGANLNGTGNTSANTIIGNKGDNVLKGLGGADNMKGGKGDDKLLGGPGDDTLDGGRGDDILVGGNGFDTFLFKTGGDRDTILDFDPNSNLEKVDLSGVASITGFSDLKNNHMSQQGNDVVINAGGGDVLTLKGIDIGDLQQGDFIF